MADNLTVLIADDDPNKIRQLRAFLHSDYPQAALIERNSFISGLKCALLEEPDIVLLDMTMPTYDVGGKETGGYERRYAGYEVLRRLKRRRKIMPVIIVTQFERFGDGDDLITLSELKEQLSDAYPENYIATVFYQAADANWRSDLRLALNEAVTRIDDKERPNGPSVDS